MNLPVGATYRIKKYLYGLPDAGLAYYRAYSTHLIAGGFKRTVSDPCLFVKQCSKGLTYVWCHVDDTFICASTPELVSDFTAYVSSKFNITTEPAVEEYLGLKLTDVNGGCLITQPKLLSTLELRYHDELLPFNRANSPQRNPQYSNPDPTPMSSTIYLQLLGSLIYLMKSRPDISTAVSFAARHGSNPTVGHYDDLLHILAYLLKTRTMGLLLRRGTPHQQLSLRCYADASYLTHDDSSQSHAGYCLSFGELGTFYSNVFHSLPSTSWITDLSH